MKLATSKNGEATLKKASDGTSMPKSDVILKSVFTEKDGKLTANSNFHFNGSFEKLGLESNGFNFGINDAGNVALVVLPDTNPNCLCYSKTDKNAKGKSKFVKITNLVKMLGQAGVIGSPESDKVKNNTIFAQFLTLKKVENDIDTPEGTIATYQIVKATEDVDGTETEVAPIYTAIREVSEEVKAKIKASKTKTAQA